MYKKFILYILSGLFCLIGCTTNRQGTSLQDKLLVNWELKSNTYTDQARAKAVFTLTNNSKFALGPLEWTMYFNMAPRTIIPSSDSALADIIHISGDWYKLVPRKNMDFQSGAAVDIYYEFHGWQIKESDAPEGIYFVYHNYPGDEEIILPGHYSITPFTRDEQIQRSVNDFEPLPTPENRYLNYLKYRSDEIPALLPLIPSPYKLESDNRIHILDNNFSIVYHPALKSEAEFLAGKLNEIAGLEIKPVNSSETGRSAISLILKAVNVNGKEEESYHLEVKENVISVTGDKAGVFYGIQSLLNIISPEVYEKKPGQVELPSLYIEDCPRFQYRGLHIDVCRNFQPKEQLFKIIDLMAFYKLNRLHLYLAEDEGWRLEIEELPELTEIGSKRGHTLDEKDFLHPSYGSGPFPDSENNHGTGYYTRNDFKEIIRFAYERHISVIPTFNMPGHARAAIKAMEVRFERFISEDKITEANEFRLIDRDDRSKYLSAQFYNDNVVCVGCESVYRFFETVVDDIAEMYGEAGVPLTMIHTGGDEVPAGAWSRSPYCLKLLDAHPEIGGPDKLQHYFFRRITRILNDRNLQVGGWEEVALTKDESGANRVNPEFATGNIIPYIYNNLDGSQDLAYQLANAGYPVVLCPVTNFYFDLAYSNDPLEPGLYWGGFVDERNAWEFAPYNLFLTTTEASMGKLTEIEKEYTALEQLTLGAHKNIAGLQAQLWHETIKGGEMMEYYLLPKLISFSERCWAKPAKWETISDQLVREKIMNEEWMQFCYTIYNQELPRLAFLNGGYNYRIPPAGFIINDGHLEAIAASPGLDIRYTTTQDIPDIYSIEYSTPLPLSDLIQLVVFDRTGRSSRVVSSCFVQCMTQSSQVKDSLFEF